MEDNIILSTDAYKQTHWKQYPKGTQNVYSYFESRGGEFDEVVFFGLQYIILRHLLGQVVTKEKIDEAESFCKQMFGRDYFNRAGWEHILNHHNGHLPIQIRAVREGWVVPVKNLMMEVINTDPVVPWITNFVETLLMQAWYPCTVATISYKIKKMIKLYAFRTGCDLSPFHLNDFGFRGVSSKESAGIGGMAHLLSFAGTDTIEGIRYAMEYYGADVCGHSVMASEHSTTTIYGKQHEVDAFSNIIDAAGDDALVSIVIDSYDTLNAVTNLLGTQLKDKILARKGKVVLRPDSGDPVAMSLEVVKALHKTFGAVQNKYGYFELNPSVGVIYGDGINHISIGSILDNLWKNDYAVSNIVFGMGGGLLQKIDRDTQKFAFKCSAAIIDGKEVPVFKDPITDNVKKSKRGFLCLDYDPDKEKLYTKTDLTYDEWRKNITNDNLMHEVFYNGKITKYQTFNEIKAFQNQYVS